MKSASANAEFALQPAVAPAPEKAQEAGSSLKENAQRTVFPILVAISASHFINDMLQSLISALYPLFKVSFALNFTHIGLITLVFQLTASILQPFVGHFTDKRPLPFSLPVGMAFAMLGIIFVSFASSFAALLASVALLGIASSIFHPEASRMAYLAAGKRRGLAQSLFQLGGNGGTAFGPLLAVLVVSQTNVLWFTLPALLGIGVLTRVGTWYRGNMKRSKANTKKIAAEVAPLPRRSVITAVCILLALIFSKYFYIASIISYYTFYLMDKFHVSVRDAQLHLFIFSFSVAAGTFIGGPLGDRFGRKVVIWFSILGVAPFSLLLPHANLFWTSVLSVFIGLILSSAFSAILVYAQELMPGKVGLISGLFFGFAFGMGGIGSAVLGRLADATSIHFVFQICAFLPLIGLLAGFLPDARKPRAA